MSAVLLLYLLATLDAALSGYRTAGGRNSLIRKGTYFRRALVHGALVGQCFIASIALAVGIALGFSPAPRDLASQFEEACGRLMEVYFPYSVVLVSALALRLLPSVDLRSVLNILIFGPFTFIRPAVGVAGVLWAFAGVPRLEVLVIGMTGIFSMLCAEWWLNRRQDQRGRSVTCKE